MKRWRTSTAWQSTSELVCLALTVGYLGVCLAVGGIHRYTGFPLWFFMPAFMTLVASMIVDVRLPTLPIPWRQQTGYGRPPRRIHLSSRSAVRLPAYTPPMLIPWHFLSIMQTHDELGWGLYVLVAAVLAIIARLVWVCRRQIRLLRDGDVAIAEVDSQQFRKGWANLITYHFTTPDGTTLSGTSWDKGYRLYKGSAVPVFYDVNDSRNHVVASASWFEAD